MSFRIRNLMEELADIAPWETQEPWDNSGLMLGNGETLCTGLYLDLDLTPDTLRAAGEAGLNTILTHHPILFTPLRTVDTGQPRGSLLQAALRGEFQVIAMHTNLDHALGGVNDALAEALGIAATWPVPEGIGRLAEVPEEIGETWLHRIASTLRCTPRYAGNPDKRIRRVALCGGACGELIERARELSVDLIITSEVKHHQALLAGGTDVLVIDAGHYETEYPVLASLAAELESRIDVPVHIAPFVPPFQSYFRKT